MWQAKLPNAGGMGKSSRPPATSTPVAAAMMCAATDAIEQALFTCSVRMPVSPGD